MTGGGGGVRGRAAHHEGKWGQNEENIGDEAEVVEEGHDDRLALHFDIEHAEDRCLTEAAELAHHAGSGRIGMAPDAKVKRVEARAQIALMDLRVAAEHRNQDRDTDTAANRADHVEKTRRGAHFFFGRRRQG